jgi:hypothetical protein
MSLPIWPIAAPDVCDGTQLARLWRKVEQSLELLAFIALAMAAMAR